MPKLTVKQLEALSEGDNGRTLSDGDNLIGKVIARNKGMTVAFYYRYRWQGKHKDFSCGSWPKKTLSKIRQERDQTATLLSRGIDPAAAKKASRIEAQDAVKATIAAAEQQQMENLTVSDLINEWLRDGVARQDGNAELRRSFGKDVLPVIGKRTIRELTEKDLLKVLRKVRARGLNRAVVVLNNDLGQMLHWAEKRKPWRALMIDGNPADLVDVKKLLDHDYQEERDRILSAKEVRELRDIFASLERDYATLPPGQKYTGIRPVNVRVQCALWICLGTLCRIGELLMAEWKHLDLDEGTWLVPAENTKGHKGKRQDHHIFLSSFALSQFKRLHKETGHTRFCFPGKDLKKHVDVKTVSKLVGDRQVQFKNRTKPPSGRHHDNTLVLSDGNCGEWTPHDLRRTGATWMQELGVPLEIIDRCQNHVIGGSKVRRHYLHHDYRQEKTEAWQRLGERIEAILGSEKVKPIRNQRS